ncbi:acyl-coenzyme A thioesterase 1-like [Thalassophryne amazonica]|uniref:acyl-coenzyme A thioesterase 1-like n=1 Tax=Thalassophryne amazonica TaxID=390379 RepID=UPI00147173B2|nr:acyl-coenzyme A thioesterase 1-like [Thalassophryne amazonica]
MTSQVQLKLLPRVRCLFDEPIQLKVAGLKSRQVVSVRANATDDKGVVFSSAATYKADGNGEIDLQRDPSMSGSYIGAQPMGLLWSMKPEILHSRMHKTRALNPYMVTFSVHEEEGNDRVLAEVVNERLLMGDGVIRTPINNGKICGVLFTPPGPGPFPAVLDLYTSGGGLSEKRPALLASRGFVVLTVGLYGCGENQKTNEIHLDYFEEAIEFLRGQDKVCSKGVGVISLSKSGDLALSAASYLSGVEATVWINGCSANTLLPLHYKKNIILPPLMYDTSKIITTELGAALIKYTMFDPRAEENKSCVVPIEQAKGCFLFVAAEDDLNWDSKAFVEQMVERLKHYGKKNFEVLSYPGAGHYLEPPYGPHCTSSRHVLVGKPVVWGGVSSSHAAAEVHLWKKIQEFFRSHLTGDGAQGKAML